ncbi:hypothetical protein ACSX1A_03150 [Pontibacter sp. MBLB2868]|uniref:hypothetical protein n=1 Tax=Pontibacter sp. MBLB2868 TaxID=3451555 RepID=UPI003F752DA4
MLNNRDLLNQRRYNQCRQQPRNGVDNDMPVEPVVKPTLNSCTNRDQYYNGYYHAPIPGTI